MAVRLVGADRDLVGRVHAAGAAASVDGRAARCVPRDTGRARPAARPVGADGPGRATAALSDGCMKTVAQRDEYGHLIGEFGFPVEGPDWEKSCDECEAHMDAFLRQIKSGAPLPALSPGIALLIDKVIAQRVNQRPHGQVAA